MTRLFLLAHFPDDSEEMLGPFSSIEEAVDQQSSYGKGQHTDMEYSCLLEAIRNIHGWYTLDRTEEFIEAWIERDPRGPKIRTPSVKNFSLQAAE